MENSNELLLCWVLWENPQIDNENSDLKLLTESVSHGDKSINCTKSIPEWLFKISKLILIEIPPKTTNYLSATFSVSRNFCFKFISIRIS